MMQAGALPKGTLKEIIENEFGVVKSWFGASFKANIALGEIDK